MGPLIPLCWTFGDICTQYQSQGGFYIITFIFHRLNAMNSSDLHLSATLLASWTASMTTNSTFRAMMRRGAFMAHALTHGRAFAGWL